MSTTPISSESAPRVSTAGTVDTNLEVVVIPVSDVERAKHFYEGLGWRLDADFARGDWRVVQLTPPGSQCSIQFGEGLTSAPPGSVKGLYLVVTDITAARAELIGAGAGVSEVFHLDGAGLDVSGTKGRAPGPDPLGRSYFSYASFSDPDGNGWLLQEIKTRLPGRGFGVDIATLTELLREAELHHGPYEAKAPKHHWSGWYGAYIVARERGRTSEEAIKEASRYVDAAAQTKPA
jgi:catechol 2,3-dioxygenase-like lactoylglutathione lyase family enzyme